MSELLPSKTLCVLALVMLAGCTEYESGWNGAKIAIQEQCDKNGQFYVANGVRYKCQREEWK